MVNMDGPISSLIQAVLVLFLAIFVFMGAISGVASTYGQNTTPAVQNLIDLSTQNTGNNSTIMNWATQMSTNVTSNSWTQVFMLTTGSLAIMGNMVTTLPSIFYAVFTVFIGAIMIPLGVAPEFTIIVTNIFAVIILLTFSFAVLKAITKVEV
jgi:hypothetical protein